MEYWNDILTEKSWDLLKEINKSFKFILIGGWAVYLLTKTNKSKDIDIVIDFKTLEKLKLNYQIKKNESLKKYEIILDEVSIDIYIPYYSKLTVPVEDIKNYTTKIENLELVTPEALLILKQGASLNRRDTEKGIKDKIDIINLLFYSNINFKEYFKLLKKYKLEYLLDKLIEILKTFKDIGYLNLNPRQFKLKKEDIFKKLKFLK